jgi:hypothetical protein
MTNLTQWESSRARAEALHREIEQEAVKPERRCANCGSAPDPRGMFWCECGKAHGKEA